MQLAVPDIAHWASARLKLNVVFHIHYFLVITLSFIIVSSRDLRVKVYATTYKVLYSEMLL